MSRSTASIGTFPSALSDGIHLQGMSPGTASTSATKNEEQVCRLANVLVTRRCEGRPGLYLYAHDSRGHLRHARRA